MQINADATLYILALPFWVCVCVWGGGSTLAWKVFGKLF